MMLCHKAHQQVLTFESDFNDADAIISDFCKQRKIRYTRYADDLSFSGDFNENELLNKVTKTVENFNLRINKPKRNS